MAPVDRSIAPPPPEMDEYEPRGDLPPNPNHHTAPASPTAPRRPKVSPIPSLAPLPTPFLDPPAHYSPDTPGRFWQLNPSPHANVLVALICIDPHVFMLEDSAYEYTHPDSKVEAAHDASLRAGWHWKYSHEVTGSSREETSPLVGSRSRVAGMRRGAPGHVDATRQSSRSSLALRRAPFVIGDQWRVLSGKHWQLNPSM